MSLGCAKFKRQACQVEVLTSRRYEPGALESCAQGYKVRSLHRSEIKAMEADVLTKGESYVRHKGKGP